MSTIDILTAIDDTWTSQQPNTQVDLLKSDNGSLIFSLGGKSSYTWAENSDMAAWGLVNLAADTNTANKVTFQAGSANDIATRFKENGTLNDEYASYQSGDLVALAYHISTPRSKSSSTSVTFAIGLEQDNAFNWLGEPQTGYYQATISGTENVVDHFFADAFTADAEGIVLDKRITDIGAEISSNYSDILESTIRQIWGGFQILIPQASKDTTMAKAWMKEISTDGNVQTVADLLPKSFPVFYTLAPDYMRLLLKPLMEYSLVWPAEFGFHDLGKHYPNATGETVATEEALIVDQTSVLLWMAYAYQRASKNTEWVKPYISALTKFADYLVNNGLYPAKQMSSTDSITPTANQTILAMYAAIGLTSFGALTEQSNYTAIGKNFTSVILKLGTDSNDTHIIAHYGDPDTSWISTYPFAFDKMLGLNTFNETTYEMQSIWYEGQLHPYGIPFYSGVDYTVAEFMAWCAATSSQSVSEALINGIYAFLADGMNNVPGPTVWYVTGSQSGEWDSSIAKSTCGSYFMPLAVNMHQKA
ncbi:uncharacterized protein PFLUO_LOCUS2217 [Penicillium psychrofluorescens]|uniref:uncharacterized protein n=1 Tax=Penicillium psychrofluorescens TaxID=3158075 RepID=UPI003CCD028F